MNLAEWAETQGIARGTAYRWFREGNPAARIAHRVHTAYSRWLWILTGEVLMAKETVSTKTSRDQRLNFRASARQELMIRRAAEATDSTITDFILGSVMESAERVLADRTWFIANEDQWTEFQRLLDAPLPPMPKLDRLQRRVSPFDESDPETLG